MRKIVEDVSPHPNVIHLYDVYEDMYGVHLVLELCSGGELFDRIVAHERYSEVEAAEVVRQIAWGLGALHRANIVHRDLKPENCLFLDSGEHSSLKIMDFGLSSVEDFTDPIVALFGSIDYVSPEALSQRQVPPFHATSTTDKQHRILAGDFSFEEHTWKTITSSAKDLISSLLAVEPYRRPTAADLLKHPWVVGGCAKQELMDAEVVSRLQSFNARRNLSPISCSNRDNATLNEFEEVLKAINMESLIPLAPRVFDLFDNNRDGTVDMREILCGLSSIKTLKAMMPCASAFRCMMLIDQDVLQQRNWHQCLDCLPADITEPGKLDEIFDQMDANSDGKVSLRSLKQPCRGTALCKMWSFLLCALYSSLVG
ncbi:hypothetical protein HPP92_017883 [Vanilla planifolia]|uniref:Calcium-and calmodulin-dependent protein kinase n=1 Tax=Vanilla planifolia TaxID=51239 RepID=A0A835Q7S2_VANPL|nr:hypothetical protein HPP92_017883 [Vanilla planifolia]